MPTWVKIGTTHRGTRGGGGGGEGYLFYIEQKAIYNDYQINMDDGPEE